MANHERVEGPTPAGGAYAVAYFSDAKGNPCIKALASSMEIVEFNKKGEEISRTYGTTKPIVKGLAVHNLRKARG